MIEMTRSTRTRASARSCSCRACSRRWRCVAYAHACTAHTHTHTRCLCGAAAAAHSWSPAQRARPWSRRAPRAARWGPSQWTRTCCKPQGSYLYIYTNTHTHTHTHTRFSTFVYMNITTNSMHGDASIGGRRRRRGSISCCAVRRRSALRLHSTGDGRESLRNPPQLLYRRRRPLSVKSNSISAAGTNRSVQHQCTRVPAERRAAHLKLFLHRNPQLPLARRGNLRLVPSPQRLNTNTNTKYTCDTA